MEGLKFAICFVESKELADVGNSPKLVDPIVFDLLERRLPLLVGGCRIWEGENLTDKPEARRDRLQHRVVSDLHEPELGRLVPAESGGIQPCGLA